GRVVAGALSLIAIPSWWGPAMGAVHWDEYRRLADQQSSVAASPAEASERPVRDLMRELDELLKLNPRDARAHPPMAAMRLRTFEQQQRTSANAMTLTQIRDAAIASQFPSREELDRWPSAAIGPNRDYLDRAWRHARRRLELCPLQGE